MKKCTCFDLPMIPRRPRKEFRPDPNCPKHQQIAERWDSIKSEKELRNLMAECDKDND